MPGKPKIESALAVSLTPEAQELQKKQVELAGIEEELGQAELDLATVQAELRAFRQRYVRTVGTRYAQLDEIEARIAELLAAANPDDPTAAAQAQTASAHAAETRQAVEGEAGTASAPEDFKPSEELRQLYRKVAKLVHPDLATDPAERVRRHRFMAEANAAYAAGDMARLEAILREWESSPESVPGDGTGAELVRTIRTIALCKARLDAIAKEIAELRGSDLLQLRAKVLVAESAGQDLLATMAADLDCQIEQAQARHDAIARKADRT